MSATIITATEIARRREEREQRRREREALAGTILDPLAHEDDQPSAPASPARKKEHQT